MKIRVSFTSRTFLICLWFCITIFLVLFGIRKNTSLWFDEVWVIGAISDSTSFGKYLITIIRDHQQPLLFAMEYFVYKLFGSNELVLRLPSIISVAAGIVVLFRLGLKYNDKVGVFPSLLAFFSYTLLCVGAYSARPYGLLFFTSSLVVYYFNDRSNHRGSYALSLCLLSLTHWFGLLLGFCMLAIDLLDTCLSKCSRRHLLAYLALIPALIWTFLVILLGGKSLLSFWVSVPGIKDVLGLFRYLCGYVNFYFIIFFAGSLLSIICYIAKKEDNLLFLMSVVVVVLMILPVYVYSKYINPAGSLFSYTYFICLLPFVYLIISYLLSFIINVPISINDIPTKVKVYGVSLKCLITCLLVLLVVKGGIRDYKACLHDPLIVNHYRQASEFIGADKSFLADDSFVLLGCDDIKGGYVSKGFLDFYFEGKNKSLPCNVGWVDGDEIVCVRWENRNTNKTIKTKELDKEKLLIVEGEIPETLRDRYVSNQESEGFSSFNRKH